MSDLVNSQLEAWQPGEVGAFLTQIVQPHQDLVLSPSLDLTQMERGESVALPPSLGERDHSRAAGILRFDG